MLLSFELELGKKEGLVVERRRSLNCLIENPRVEMLARGLYAPRQSFCVF